MKIAFMGSPRFAAEVLQGIIGHHEIVAVVTQPDAAAGRGHQIQFNPVKQLAIKHQIPVLQPSKISNDVQPLIDLHPDIIVTCAFGQILRQSVLDAAPLGVINVHGSLLPRYRGAAPVQWAVINGDAFTGITIAKTELGLDSGPIITAKALEIPETATAGDVFEALVPVAIQTLLQALDQISAGTAVYTPQNQAEVTIAPMLHKEMARIDWTRDAVSLANLVRGLNPWPVAYFLLDGLPVKVFRACALENMTVSNGPGKIVLCNARDGLVISCGRGCLRIDALQIPGKKQMSGADFCNGRDLSTAVIA